ncbi:MAG: hypothetical protein GY942_15500, partial [Aestuariibacter sp.]|nr:hypothetical protein [Aestuariibacter sp.]
MASLPSIAVPQTQRIPLPFASYKTRAPRGGVTQLVNCAAEQGQAKGDILLNGVPGQTLTNTLPHGIQRGAIKFQNAPHVVAGNKLYKLNENDTYTELATVPGLDHVPMAQNGAQLVIVVRPTAYVWDGSTLAQITDPDFRDAIDCTFNGNFILFVEADSGRFFGSELGEATDYDSLDFATAESFPDDLVGIGSDHGDVFLAGTETCELWGNVGGSGFPYSKRYNGSIEQGCGAGKSIINADQSLFWIDETRIARRLNGVTPVRISQHGVEVAWQKYTTIADAEGFSYTLDGHIYCVWTFPTANKTWEYDVTAQQWHE